MGAKNYPQIACYVTPTQHEALKRLAHVRGVPITALLREAVDGLLGRPSGRARVRAVDWERICPERARLYRAPFETEAGDCATELVEIRAGA